MAKLYFYYSAMNAGKTTILLQSAHNYQERGMNVLLFTPKIDDRYAAGFIHSRIGLKSQAIAFDAQDNLFELACQQLQQKSIACVLLDEAHFLSKDQVLQLCDIVDEKNIPVLTYGLRSDFRGEPFAGSEYLLIYADNLNEIKTICHCGKKAIMNLRIDENGIALQDGAQTQIGGNELYRSVCRKHFKEARLGKIHVK